MADETSDEHGQALLAEVADMPGATGVLYRWVTPPRGDRDYSDTPLEYAVVGVPTLIGDGGVMLYGRYERGWVANPGGRALVAHLLAECERYRDAEITMSSWGIQLMEGFADFVAKAAKSSGPLTTKMMCSFPDVPEFPVLHLWATTDGQHPVARNSDLRQQLTERDRRIVELEGELAKYAEASALSKPAPSAG